MLNYRITRRGWLCGMGLAVSLPVSLLVACNRSKLVDNRPKLSPSAASGSVSSAIPLTLTSSSFQSTAFIHSQFTCDGANQSPALNWSAPPEGTQSWVVMLESSGSIPQVHWLIYDLPASLGQLPAALPNQPFLTQGGLQAKNDFGQYGYRGPCRSSNNGTGDGATSYLLRLYAVGALLDLPPGASTNEIRTALQSQILAETSLTIRYRPPS